MFNTQQIRSTFGLAVMLLGVTTATGCSNLERNLQDPAIWDRVAEITNRTQRNIDRYERQKAMDARAAAERKRQRAQPRGLPIDGRWSFIAGWSQGFGTATPISAVNRVVRVNGGIRATREGGGSKSDFYAQVAPNVFKNNKGHTYRFTSRDRGVWVKAGGGKTIKLHREW